MHFRTFWPGTTHVGIFPPLAGADRVRISNLAEAIETSWLASGKHKAADSLENGTEKKARVDKGMGQKKKVGVLISGTGMHTGFEAWEKILYLSWTDFSCLV